MFEKPEAMVAVCAVWWVMGGDGMSSFLYEAKGVSGRNKNPRMRGRSSKDTVFDARLLGMPVVPSSLPRTMRRRDASMVA